VRITLLTLALFLGNQSRGQHLSLQPNQQALFTSLQDVCGIRPDTNCHLKKIEDVRVDSLVHRCWFTDREKGMIKGAFAVHYHGQLYFQDQALRQLLPPTFHPHARQGSNCYYPATQQGRFYYFEILSEDKNPDLSIAMGMMGGVVGSAFGTTLTPPENILSMVILDTRTNALFAIESWKDMHVFLEKYAREYPLPGRYDRPTGEEVRNILLGLEKY
jgi:hypothetical protein